jgi:hypothetical protein
VALSFSGSPALITLETRAGVPQGAAQTQAVERLIYFMNAHRVRRQDLVLAWPCALVLRYRSGQAVQRPERDLRVCDVWLGNDPGKGSDRENGVGHIAISKGWQLHCAYQSQCPKSRKS